MNSNDAPPPVDTCVILSVSPIASTASAVEPPPTTVGHGLSYRPCSLFKSGHFENTHRAVPNDSLAFRQVGSELHGTVGAYIHDIRSVGDLVELHDLHLVRSPGEFVGDY